MQTQRTNECISASIRIYHLRGRYGRYSHAPGSLRLMHDHSTIQTNQCLVQNPVRFSTTPIIYILKPIIFSYNPIMFSIKDSHTWSTIRVGNLPPVITTTAPAGRNLPHFTILIQNPSFLIQNS